MAHLWFRAAPAAEATSADGSDWLRRPLDAEILIGDARLQRASTPDGARWVVVGSSAVRVNGLALATGIAVLRDRDELWVAGQRLFFSSEILAVVVPFAGSDRPVRCARCKTEIALGSPAVACPRCGVWHHQSDRFGCWTYAEHCAGCDQTTALDADYRFTPEAL